ncbi:helix-turn-helix domain-containing protein [Labrenzia sp. PHM005]|uniref:helix-turn-helix domain-containing protein n=1 Tax=Labrenzia sp. PHM005 TaxID=2590016 RepID=UPI00114024A4|nr:helix-turn-helix domain-containing protein [Labrenzia sp. PHM005]QDG79371.1 helix-turn-helix domain-containing protein [Labrenzia sp. PHM005]
MESPQEKTNTKLLNETEAAEYLGLSVRTLQAWRVQGGKIGFIRLGRSIRYRPQDLENWICSNRLTSTSQVEVRT